MLISLAVHAGAFVVVGTGGGRSGHMQAESERLPVISAYLAAPNVSVGLPAATDALPRTERSDLPSPRLAPAGDRTPNALAPLVEFTAPAGPYYYRPRELTRRPILLGDAISRLVIELPGFPPVPVILRLLISDDGVVDRVLVEDSYLPEVIETQIVQAFANVRFLPGKIDDTAVRSQLRLEVRLENAAEVPKAQEENAQQAE
jgi:hypothetical protein